MKTKIKSNTLSTGLAMFSMFFGAGNVVFPLAMGQFAQDKNVFATLGLLLTAVGAPFLGLLAMTLFDGDHKKFFERIGKVPGFLIVLAIMGLIGPFGAMPRVIALSFSTTKIFFPGITLIGFSAFSCILVYLLTYKRSRLLDILGYVLTPILLLSLGVLIVKGILTAAPPESTNLPALSAFFHGLQEGYNMMDLMAAFFFSSVVILCLKKELHPEDQGDFRRLIKMTLKAGCIGASLLAMVYIGSSYLASYHSLILTSVPKDEILAALALQILGPNAGIVAIVAVSLACLTTAMALAAVFAEFVHEDLTLRKFSYNNSLILTLLITFSLSMLNFSGIMSFLVPILTILYPSLIVLAVTNILYKLYGFKPVVLPFTAVLLLSIFFYFF